MKSTDYKVFALSKKLYKVQIKHVFGTTETKSKRSKIGYYKGERLTKKNHIKEEKGTREMV